MLLKDNVHGLFCEEHGGDCCGIMHIHHFPRVQAFSGRVTRKEKLAWLARAAYEVVGNYNIDDDEAPENWNTLMEVVLISEQLQTWRSVLEEAGFTMVYQFLNSNSGNVCYVFLGETTTLFENLKKN